MKRSLVPLVTAIVVMLVVQTSFSAGQWVPTNGPHGVSVTAFGSAGSVLYAGSNGPCFVNGIYRSLDSGVSWTLSYQSLNDYPISFASIGTTIFAATVNTSGMGDIDSGCVLRSLDSGATWTVVNSGIPNTLAVLAIVTSKDILYAAISTMTTLVPNVYMSTDSGATWKLSVKGLDSNHVISFSSVGDAIYAGTVRGVFVSRGSRWDPVNTGLPDSTKVRCIVGSEVGAGCLFAGTDSGVYKTAMKGGISWTKINTGLTDTAVKCLAMNGTALVAGTNSGVFFSTDTTTWVKINTGLAYHSIHALIVNGADLWAGSYKTTAIVDGGIYRFSDATQSWTGATAFNAGYVNALAVKAPNVIFAGTAAGMFRTSNNGDVWEMNSTNFASTNTYNVQSVAVAEKYLFAGIAYSGVYRALNDGGMWYDNGRQGEIWYRAGVGISSPYPMRVSAFATISNSTLLVGTFNGAYRSLDTGNTWTLRTLDITGLYTDVSAFTVMGSTILAGYSNGGGVYRSLDNGTTWTHIGAGLPPTRIRALAANGSTLFAGTNRGIYVSANNGDNWTKANTGLTDTNVWSFAVNSTRIFAGTGSGGVFLSMNSGAGWSDISSGLPGAAVRCLAVCGTDLLGGTAGYGVWKRPLRELIHYGLTSATAYEGTGILQMGPDADDYVILRFSTPTDKFAVSTSNIDSLFPLNNGHSWKDGFGFTGNAVWNGAGDQLLILLTATLSPPTVRVGDTMTCYGDTVVLGGTFDLSTSINSAAILTKEYLNLSMDLHNSRAAVKFFLPQAEYVLLKIYDARGSLVATLANGRLGSGSHRLALNAKSLGSGIYVCRMQAGNFSQVKRFTLIK
jgi:hypothetical protein